MGHEFTSPGARPSADRRLSAEGGRGPFWKRSETWTWTTTSKTFVSLSCQSCPDVVQALNLMAVLNPKSAPHHDRRAPVVSRRGRAAASHGGAGRVF